jgi:hypothetical protein
VDTLDPLLAVIGLVAVTIEFARPTASGFTTTDPVGVIETLPLIVAEIVLV